MQTLTKNAIELTSQEFGQVGLYADANTSNFYNEIITQINSIKRIMTTIRYHGEIIRLQSQIMIDYVCENGIWFATNEDYEIFSSGKTYEDAKIDFYSLLYETYQQYKKDDDVLLSDDALILKKKMLLLFHNEF